MSPRKAAEPDPYRVWSWWQGAWWMVDHGTDLTAMTHSAVGRQVFVSTPQRLRGYPHPVTVNPRGQFVVTVPGQTPQEALEMGLP